jgi:hypothetical protein
MGWAGPADWAELSPRIGGPTSAQNDWADLGPEYFLGLVFGPGWANTCPAQMQC